MAEPDLLGMYGATTPARDVAMAAQAEEERRRRLTHSAPMEPAGGLAAVPRYTPVTALGQAQAAPMVPSDAEQEALIAEAQAARAALDASEARDPTAQQAVEGAYGGNLARYQALEERRQALQPFTVARNNPAAKYAQRQYVEQRAGDGMGTPATFEPQPFATPPREMGESDAAYMERVQLAKDAHDADQLLAQQEYEAAVAEGMAVPAARDVGRDGNVGFIESERRVGEQRTAAEVRAAERITAMETRAAEANRAAIAEAREANREMQQQREDAITAVQRLQDVEKEARAKLEAMPAIDGQRYTQRMGWGAKIAALGAAFAGGFSGAGSMADELRKLREEDVEEQRLAHEIGVRNYEAASGAVQQGLQVYDAVMQGLGDRQIADDVYRNLVDEDMIQALREEAAQAELPIVKAQYEQAALEMEQQLRARRDATAYKAETTPQTIVSTVDPNRAERRWVEKQMERASDQLDKLELAGVDVAKARDAQAASLAEKRAEGESKVRAQVEGERAKQEMDIKKASDEWGAVETLVQDYIKETKGNFHGVGAPLTGSQEDRIKTRNFMRALELLGTKGFTGATATDRQVEQIRSLIEGDWTEITDEAFATRLNSILNIASAQRRYYQNQLGSASKRMTASEIPSFRADE